MSLRPQEEKKNPKRGVASRLAYLPGLDGLRAFAVIAVLLYHADLHVLAGGFLGVEIFFVISGYLITSLLLVEWQAQGRIGFRQFWLRRARRLLPALFLLLASVMTFAVLALPDEAAGLRSDVAAALGYATNWYLILANKSYFESVGRPSLLRHLWSLAVEEQFYVLWPLLLSLLLKWLRGRRALLVILLGAIASAALMAVLYQPDVDPSRVYYGTDTRAFGLLLGAALALAWRPWQNKKQGRGLSHRQLDLIGLLGLGVLGWACWQISEFDPWLYRGGMAVVSLATALVIAVAAHPRSRLLSRFLAWRPFVWVGVRSYGIYLWHWPIYMVTRPQLDVQLDGLPLLAVRLAATFVLAGLSYRFVETPIRTGALGRAWHGWRDAQGAPRRAWALGWSAAVASVAVFLIALGWSAASAQPAAPPAYLADLMDAIPVQAASGDASPSSASPATDMVSTDPLVLASSAETSDPVTLASSASSSDLGAAMAYGSAELAPAPPDAAGLEEGPDWPTNARRPAAAVPPTSAAPTPRPLVTGVAVTAIGDSVMLGAAPALRRAIEGIDVDAQMSRQVGAAIEILRARRDANQLGEVVVVHMGTNGGFSSRQFDQIMAILTDVRRVIFVNDKVPRAWQDANNQALAAGVKRYPQAVLLDWQAASSSHPELFWNDGIHLRPEGAKFYAELIAVEINAP